MINIKSSLINRNSGPWRRVASTRDNHDGTSKNQYDKERYPGMNGFALAL